MAAAIANRGYYYTPHLVRALQDQEGNIIPSPQSLQRMKQALPPSISFLLSMVWN
ncbi:MAG: hypothetical protein R2795_12990 [Saprospiraceae bacterium]